MSRRLFLSLTAAAYLAVGLLAYARILHVGFMGDDWMFLDVVATAKDLSVMFATLNARYTRPLIVLVYYLNFHHFGLWTFPAHLLVVLLHIVNAWLVCLLALRLAPPPHRLLAAGAGLIFLVFAGHSEAVAWVAGMADAAVALFLVGALLLFDRALEDPKPARWLIAGWIAGVMALLAKETALLLPALAFAYGVAAAGRSKPRRPPLVRTVIFCGGTAILCVGYWAFRTARYGSALAAYSGMGTSEGQRVAVARMFFLRAFMPPGGIAVRMWTHYLDLAFLAGLVIAAAIVMRRDKDSRAGLAFAGAALVIALGPALPLSISLVTTLTERYLYLATVFSSILIAWLVVRLVRPQLLAAVAIAILAAGQWHYLGRSNQTWIDGDAVFRSVVSGVISLAQTHAPIGRSEILLLNMPDTIGRPYVDGAGVFSALRLMNPGLPEPEAHLKIVAMHDAPMAKSLVSVQQSGRTFTVDVGRDTVVDGWLHDAAEYAVVGRAPHRFVVRLNPMTRHALVAYTTNREVRLAADVDGVPFGFVDAPADEAVCAGESMRFVGWALDDESGVSVALEREVAGGSWAPVGMAEWRTGTRPDVERLFPGFPSIDRAEWDYQLPCALVRSQLSPVTIRILARDRAGQRVMLGTRTIRSR